MGQSFYEVYWRSGMKEAARKEYAKGVLTRHDMEVALWPRDGHGTLLQTVDRIEQLFAAWTPILDKTYRVLIDVNTGKVEVVCLGIDSVDHEAEGIYQQVEDLPMWMQEKLAVLSMMEVNPPQEEVNGVGIRIDGNTYWIVKS